MNHHNGFSYVDPTMLPSGFSSVAPSIDNSPSLLDSSSCSPPLFTPSSLSPYSSSRPSPFLHSHSPSPNLQSSPSLPADFIANGSPRHAFSAEDLQDGDAISGRVGRYSAEERKERIERYRSKRNQRNFQKKITYACRKTLADSRPRVRGRFVRNGETEAEASVETELADSNYGYSNSSSYDSSGESFLTAGVKEEAEVSLYGEDDEMWASFLNGLSMNLK